MGEQGDTQLASSPGIVGKRSPVGLGKPRRHERLPHVVDGQRSTDAQGFVADAAHPQRLAPLAFVYLQPVESGELLGRDTLLGRLVATAGDGEISRDELFYFALLLLLAGNETTTNLLGTMFLTLSENPDQFREIRQNPDALVASAIEEQLRFSSPIQGFYRTAKIAYRVGDATIPAGARVALLWGAANRDPRQFDNPDAFVVARNPSHVAFGSGIHLCLGASLARMESRAVLREVVERVQRIEVIGTPQWTTNSSLRGLAQMQVVLAPREDRP